ncbi:MAG: bacterioferritin [Candidatus Obscuribacterales bacterium]
MQTKVDKKRVIEALNLALEKELAGLVRYLHHSFIVIGPGRGPLVELFRNLATDSMNHAIQLGEKITALGGHPSVKVEKVDEPGDQTLEEMLQEDLAMEASHIEMYEEQLREFEKDLILKLMYEQIILEEVSHYENLQMYIRDYQPVRR